MLAEEDQTKYYELDLVISSQLSNCVSLSLIYIFMNFIHIGGKKMLIPSVAFFRSLLSRWSCLVIKHHMNKLFGILFDLWLVF